MWRGTKSSYPLTLNQFPRIRTDKLISTCCFAIKTSKARSFSPNCSEKLVFSAKHRRERERESQRVKEQQQRNSLTKQKGVTKGVVKSSRKEREREGEEDALPVEEHRGNLRTREASSDQPSWRALRKHVTAPAKLACSGGKKRPLSGAENRRELKTRVDNASWQWTTFSRGGKPKCRTKRVTNDDARSSSSSSSSSPRCLNTTWMQDSE